MSHFDDIDLVVYSAPATGFGVLVVIAGIIWALAADQSSADTCKEHGEKYVDSRIGYTLCEQDGGTVVRR